MSSCLSSQTGSQTGRSFSVKGVVYLVGILLLAIAYWYGTVLTPQNLDSIIRTKFSQYTIERVQEKPPVYSLHAADGKQFWLGIGEGKGYGGTMNVAVLIKPDGSIQQLDILTHKETPGYLIRVLSKPFFTYQFRSKDVSDSFRIAKDVDAVSGATISCRGITEATRNAAHLVATGYLKRNVTWEQTAIQFGIREAALLLLIGATFIPLVFRNKMLRNLYYALTIGVLGFWLNASLSISSISALTMGFVPDYHTTLTWWILTLSSLGAIVLLGRNIYCNKLCPFFAVQLFLGKIGIKLKLPLWVQKHGTTVADFLLWSSLLIIFLSRTPAFGSFEPFALAFSLEGVGVQWYILPLTIAGSLFITQYWCRLFCPVGRLFSVLLRTRRTCIAHCRNTQTGRNNECASMQNGRNCERHTSQKDSASTTFSVLCTGFFYVLTLFAVAMFFAQSVVDFLGR